MTEGGPGGAGAFTDAVAALGLLAVDASGLGGASLRAPAGPVRDIWLGGFRARLPAGAPVRRVPANVTAGRLAGGVDLAATLAAGRPMAERGLLAEADGGALVLVMAERATAGTVSLITAALDTGEARCERDGIALVAPARFAVIALDEGLAEDERVTPKLLDRLAFHLDLNGISPREATDPLPDADLIAAARARLPQVAIGHDVIEAVVATALALGIPSVRAALLAIKAARASASLAGRTIVEEADAALAARLVLAPRATRLPQADDDEPPPEPPQPEAPSEPPQPEPPPQQQSADDAQTPKPPAEGEQLEDMLLEAAKAAIPADLLAQLQQAGAALSRMQSQGRVGAERTAPRGGRPAGVRRGDPRQGGRLNVIETLRAAAPWQRIRQRGGEMAAPAGPRRIEVRRSDFQVNRHQQKSETATIFVVDASGSSALNRLAEAKGAVELLLADCYVRRDQVAVIAFRGQRAELLLPPTRSLVRAKRSLAGLPGGGATPLACAIEAATALAESVRRKGLAPTLILLTDGRANMSRDGRPGRELAASDAMAAARAARALGVTVLLIDTSPKPQPEAERLAAEMAAMYLPLPYADATRLSNAVRATMPGR